MIATPMRKRIIIKEGQIGPHIHTIILIHRAVKLQFL